MTHPALDDLLEAYITAEPAHKKPALNAVVKQLKATVKSGEYAAAATTLRRAISPGLDYTAALNLHRVLKSLRDQPGQIAPLRVAVLGSFTTSQLIAMIELSLFAAGIVAEVYEADFGVFRQEILDPTSALYEFRPQVLFLATSWRDLRGAPPLHGDPSNTDSLVDAEVDNWRSLWNTAYQRLGCQIIQNNFDAPAWRQLGNFELRHPTSLRRYSAAVNQAFQDHAPPFVTIHDLDELSAQIGRARWGDERFFHHAKIPCDPECLVEYGQSVASLIVALRGLGKKCLVLDLDNTLWGGVIGDDGLGGIRLGQGNPEGESFLAFQRYVKSLKDRGVILAVCSKNEDSVAKEVFEKHREMALRLEDISCFVANWEPKADNLRRIAATLNIGRDSLVFVDDNPAERALVRQLAPDVLVPELPEDPAGYIAAVESLRAFQVVSLSSEDLQRTEFYQANAQRQLQEESATNIDDFLKSLLMVAHVAPVDATSLERTAQLINKSNQFNLTTRRRSAAEVQAIADDSQWVTRTVSLQDKFGDNGLISVLLAHVDQDTLLIDTWLMSCRVLKRGVENLLLNTLVTIARERGLQKIVGEYLPTAKNVIVKDHYQNLGLTKIAEDDGRTRWSLDIGAAEPLPVFIQEEANEVDEIRTEAQQVFRDVFGDDDIVLRDEMTAEDVDGWDSTAHINLIVALEKHFKVKFAMAEISRMKDEDQNVGGLLRLIAKKLGEGWMSVASIEFIFLLLVCGALFFHLPGRGLRLAAFSVANAAALWSLLPNWQSAVALAVFLLSGYVVAKVLQRRPSGLLLTGYMLALVAAFLVLKKYEVIQWALPMSLIKHRIGIIGLSYMLFRQIHFIVDAMQDQIEGGTLCAYLNYQLNLFGILSGPIQRFQDFHEFWRDPQPTIPDRHELLKTILRINWGVLKLAGIGTACFYAYTLSSSTLDQVSRGFLVQFSAPKKLLYFALMFYSFPAYLYFNFSGYCDIVIGGAQLFGIRMPENFDQPYLARNMIDYWNRFHRTLSHWIRDYIFMPLYKGAIERTPNLAEPLSIVFMFLALFLAGVWHGSTVNWVVFGILNGIGVGAVKLWEQAIIRARGRKGHKEYLKNPRIRLAAIFVNLNFACLTYLFFPVDMVKTLHAISVLFQSV